MQIEKVRLVAESCVCLEMCYGGMLYDSGDAAPVEGCLDESKVNSYCSEHLGSVTCEDIPGPTAQSTCQEAI